MVLPGGSSWPGTRRGNAGVPGPGGSRGAAEPFCSSRRSSAVSTQGHSCTAPGLEPAAPGGTRGPGEPPVSRGAPTTPGSTHGPGRPQHPKDHPLSQLAPTTPRSTHCPGEPPLPWDPPPALGPPCEQAPPPQSQHRRRQHPGVTPRRGVRGRGAHRGVPGTHREAGAAVQVGAGGAVAALLAAPPEAAHPAGQVGAAIGAALVPLALAVQPPRRAARLCASTGAQHRGSAPELLGRAGGWYSPRHTWVLQIWLCRPSPGHAGWWHCRRRSRSPPPQETLQGPHGDHAPHSSSAGTGGKVGWHGAPPARMEPRGAWCRGSLSLTGRR